MGHLAHFFLFTRIYNQNNKSMKKLLEKIKIWLAQSGLANLLYLGIGVGIWIVPFIPAVIKSHVCVGALSIFVYLNWNVIRKLIWQKKEE